MRSGLVDISHRSETLWERLARVPAEESAWPAPGTVEQILRPWARVYAAGNHRALLRRLAWDGIDPRQAAAALSSPSRESDAAPWASSLRRYVELAASRASTPTEQVSAGEWRGGTSEIPFVELWLPWVEVALEQLNGQALDELEPSARLDLETQLLEEIATHSEAAAYQDFAARREKEGGHGAGLYQAFIADCLANPVAALYDSYPVLARQTCRRLNQWCGRVSELLTRLAADRLELAATFNEGRDPGPVRSIRGNLSDRHGDGRQVFVLEFRSGLRVVYKPRSLAPEAALARFLERCSANGLHPTPRAARVLERPRYGWMEYVPQERLPSADSAREYYRAAGALVALAHALGAQDLNAENIVATLDGPVIVDAEVLLQPVRERLTSGEESEAHRAASGSCLATGLLTQLLPHAREDRPLGGLRGWTRRRRQCRVWSDVNTDRMTAAIGQEWIGPLHNAVFIRDTFADPESYVSDLAEGFESAYRFLHSQREGFMDEAAPLEVFRGTEIRVLFRASQEYGRVVQLMGLPHNQRSGLIGSWLHEALLSVFTESDEPPSFWPFVRQERLALEAEDVPWFALPADHTAIETHEGVAVPGIFNLSGLDAARNRIAAFSEEDLTDQLALLERALAPELAPGPLRAALRGVAEGDRTDLGRGCGQLAVALGDELIGAFESDILTSDGWDLARGRLGTALFLAALGRAESKDRCAEVLHWLLEDVEEQVKPWSTSQELPLGGFYGCGSLIWSLVWLSRLLDRPALLVPAAQLAGLITPERIAADRDFDLIRGAAGAVVALLSLTEATGEPRFLETAWRCGEHLVRHQQVCASAGAGWRNRAGLFQTGWAHGSAGIARGLASLGQVAGDSRFLVAAAAAIGHERSLFNSERLNWPVAMTDSRGRRSNRWMVAWCRGAPGIALSRMFLPAEMRDEVSVAERELALDTTAVAPVMRLDHLCCGTLGRSSVLLTAAERNIGSRRGESALELAQGVIDRAIENEGFTVSSECYENRRIQPGFLQGLAGIGYQLLRLSGERDLPDVLALELPSEQAERSGGSATRQNSS